MPNLVWKPFTIYERFLDKYYKVSFWKSYYGAFSLSSGYVAAVDSYGDTIFHVLKG